MITTFILSIFLGLINLLLGFLPTGHIPAIIASVVSYGFGVLNAFSFVVPVDTLIQAIALVLGFDLALILWHFVNWIIRKVPGMQ